MSNKFSSHKSNTPIPPHTHTQIGERCETLLTQLSAPQTNVDNKRFVYIVCVSVCLCHKARGKWLKCSIIKQSQQLDELSNLLLFFDNLKFPQLNFHHFVDCTTFSCFEFGLRIFWLKFTLHDMYTMYAICLIEE